MKLKLLGIAAVMLLTGCDDDPTPLTLQGAQVLACSTAGLDLMSSTEEVTVYNFQQGSLPACSTFSKSKYWTFNFKKLPQDRWSPGDHYIFVSALTQ